MGEFRRISAYVYRCNKKWSQSIDLSKNDRMWKDCIDTANESGDSEIIENLLRFFCDSSEKECFCAALYTCFAHISPDVVIELGWLNGYTNFVMPFLGRPSRELISESKCWKSALHHHQKKMLKMALLVLMETWAVLEEVSSCLRMAAEWVAWRHKWVAWEGQICLVLE